MPEEKRGESGKSQHMHVFVYIKNENAANGRGASGKAPSPGSTLPSGLFHFPFRCAYNIYTFMYKYMHDHVWISLMKAKALANNS